MSLINVYSRSPISHQFSILEEGVEKTHVIKGTNCLGVVTFDTCIPKTNEIEETVFAAIKKKYSDLGHYKLFGGKSPQGVVYDAQIYAYSDREGPGPKKNLTAEDAAKKMNDSRPIITNNDVMLKTKGIEPLK